MAEMGRGGRRQGAPLGTLVPPSIASAYAQRAVAIARSYAGELSPADHARAGRYLVVTSALAARRRELRHAITVEDALQGIGALAFDLSFLVAFFDLERVRDVSLTGSKDAVRVADRASRVRAQLVFHRSAAPLAESEISPERVQALAERHLPSSFGWPVTRSAFARTPIDRYAAFVDGNAGPVGPYLHWPELPSELAFGELLGRACRWAGPFDLATEPPTRLPAEIELTYTDEEGTYTVMVPVPGV